MDRFGPCENLPVKVFHLKRWPSLAGRPDPTEQLPFRSTIFVTLVLQRKQIQSDWWDGTKTLANKVRKELSWTNPKCRFTILDRKSWHVKLPTYCSKGVRYGVPSVVVYLCHHVIGLAGRARTNDITKALFTSS